MRIESFLRQSPIFEASRLSRKLDAELSSILKGEQLSFFESLVLVAIFFEETSGAENPVKPSHLAETFSTSRGNISHCISSLEAKGVLLRKIDAEDARGFHLSLKPAGKKRAMRVIAILDQMQRTFEETIGTAELKQTFDRLRKVEELCAGMARKSTSGK
jgi:DNA-binding MarR family transcriptional regulator